MKIRHEITFEQLHHLRKFSAAWGLLSSTMAPFVASFLYRIFIQTNRRSITVSEIVEALDNYLYVIRQKYPDEAPPKSAKEYIEDWSSPDKAWLSQRYTGRGDMPEVDLTPDAERAIRWLESLNPRNFVGTESRLLTIFQLLNELNQKIETDPNKILDDLYKKKKEIEDQIDKFKSTGKTERPDATQIKERYYQLDDTANTLLSDFRQVEENFRKLDREVREKMTLSVKAKGEFLDDVFGGEDEISESDQGKSFRAFWEFLIHSEKQNEFEELLENVLKQPEIAMLDDKGVLPLFRDFLLDAGNKVYIVNNQLTSQLTKYLSEKSIAENKRIVEMISEMEKTILELRGTQFDKHFFSVPFLKPNLNLSASRPLFEIPDVIPLNEPIDSADETILSENDMSKLFSLNIVDEQLLERIIESSLVQNEQSSLEDILKENPPSKGLSEVISYLKIAERRKHTHIYEDKFFIAEMLNEKGNKKRVKCPQVIFQRIEL